MGNDITIFSNEIDESTDVVIEWIKYYNNEKVRIERQPEVDFVKTITLSPKDCDSVWYRRVAGRITGTFSNNSDFMVSELQSQHGAYLKEFKSNNILGTVDSIVPNKMNTLILAKSVGLSVPSTIITSSKKDLLEFYKKNVEVIFKCLSDPIVIIENSEKKTLYTSILSGVIISSMDDMFFPTLFQKRIIKQFEIRTFYLRGSFFSMAIFSSRNKQTEVDFRNYDYQNPNRTIPFNLPVDIEQKIDVLMKEMELDTASIDIIFGMDGNYYFLEVNPVV